MTIKPTILFFARGYQADFFPCLVSEHYDAVFVTMTRAESEQVRRRGQVVAACFEDDFAELDPAEVPDNYLITSFMSDRFLGRYDRGARGNILGREITFWRQLLDRHRPVAVVNELVAIEMSEALLIECRRRNIAYLAAMHTVLEDRFCWLGDPMTLAGDTFPRSEPSAGSIATAADYVDRVINKAYVPFYVRNLAGRRALRPVAVALIKWIMWKWRDRRALNGGSFRYESYVDEYGKRLEVFVKGLFRGYDKIEQLPAGREVIFYPLHQEPEATLNYMSEFMANQVATIENILKAMGPQQILVVKEHPVDKGALLRTKFAQLKERCSNLYYLPGEVPGRQIMALDSRVVTLTSTVGMEAALLGRPVYVMGEIFYDGMPGIRKVKSFDELRNLLRAPTSPPVTHEAAVYYLASIFEESYPGNPLPCDKLYEDGNIASVIHAIRTELGLADDQPDGAREVAALKRPA
jgi:hypothetical protein